MKNNIRSWFYFLMISGIVMTFTTNCKKKNDGLEGTVKDIDGNVYTKVTIGTQVWMVENLKTTRYNDGADIPNEINKSDWTSLTGGAYCWYNNSHENKTSYGALYNWNALTTGKLCPLGWHVPKDAEWTSMINFLGGNNVAGGKLKERGTTHWNSPNIGATDETGFTGLPGGYINIVESFIAMGDYGIWWSSTKDKYDIWIYSVNTDNNKAERSQGDKEAGFYVRCIKDM